MNSSLPPPIPAAPVRSSRSASVTVIAWIMMVIGVLGLPISFISLLMIIAGSYGTQHSDVLGFIIVVLGPTMLLICGFGLLKRWRIAWVATLMLVALIVISNVAELLRGERPEVSYTSSSGVKTTVSGSGPNYHSWPVIGVCAILLSKLLSGSVRSEFPAPAMPAPVVDIPLPAVPPPLTAGQTRTDWRVGHRGRDMMYYEELINGSWERLDVDGEMLMGRAHHVIYFKTASEWQNYPEWARHRRSEIITRIKSEFRAPDYEYLNDAL